MGGTIDGLCAATWIIWRCSINRCWFKTELGLLGYKFVSRPTKPGQANIRGDQVGIYTPGFQFSDDLEPPRNILLTLQDGLVTKLDTDDGVGLLRLEPVVIGGIYPAHNEDRLLVQLSEVPESLQAMLVAVEDDGFMIILVFRCVVSPVR